MRLQAIIKYLSGKKQNLYALEAETKTAIKSSIVAGIKPLLDIVFIAL